MAVGTDTIQTLLRQRQQLRGALLELRQEIESLDASSLNLVGKNIKMPAPHQKQKASALVLVMDYFHLPAAVDQRGNSSC